MLHYLSLRKEYTPFVNSDSTASNILKNECFFKGGNGETIKFWTDKWLEAGTLVCCFPQLYEISPIKTKTLVEMGDFQGRFLALEL